MTAEVPAGWYPDPANQLHERWWDGTGWTGATRDPAQRHGMASVGADTQVLGAIADAAPPAAGRVVDGPQPQRPRRSVGVGLVVVLVAIVGVFGTIAFLELREPAADDGVDTDTAAAASDPDGASTDEQSDDEAPVDGSDTPSDQDAPEEDSPDEQPSADTAPRPGEADEGDAARQVTVTLDDQCTLTLDDSEIARSDDIRPWNHPECTWAPVALPPGGERWIVVLASLNGDDFGPQETQERAATLGVPGSVLWSTHYPSLNPDLWVVYDGPYPTESAAASAARGWGASAYPRVLSDDLGDRYCLSPDGCVGEQAG